MLIDIETANPPYKVSQEKAAEELTKRMGVRPSIGRLIEAASSHSGIESRYIVVPDAEESAAERFYSRNGSYLQPDTARRMNEYERWSSELAFAAADKLIRKNNFDVNDINRLITISCTGFFAPGFDYYLIEKLDIPRNVKRTHIGFMGCAASIIGFNSVLEAMDSVHTSGVNALLVSVELCSLHLQSEPTRDNILANMIFSDGCAAALFSNSGKYKSLAKFKLLQTDSILFEGSSEMMGWKIGNTGFAMNLSSELPDVILNKAVPEAIKILNNYGINTEEIKHWALHPGGRAILDSMQKGFCLSDKVMEPSRSVLKNFGNMSSASILYVLKEIINNTHRPVQKGELCCAIAFGPGLTMEMALLRGV